MVQKTSHLMQAVAREDEGVCDRFLEAPIAVSPAQSCFFVAAWHGITRGDSSLQRPSTLLFPALVTRSDRFERSSGVAYTSFPLFCRIRFRYSRLP